MIMTHSDAFGVSHVIWAAMRYTTGANAGYIVGMHSAEIPYPTCRKRNEYRSTSQVLCVRRCALSSSESAPHLPISCLRDVSDHACDDTVHKIRNAADSMQATRAR